MMRSAPGPAPSAAYLANGIALDSSAGEYLDLRISTAVSSSFSPAFGYTVEMVVMFTQFTPGRTFFTCGTSADEDVISLTEESGKPDGTLGFGAMIGANDARGDSGTNTVALNRHYHVAASFGGPADGGSRLYINGELVGSKNVTAVPSTTGRSKCYVGSGGLLSGSDIVVSAVAISVGSMDSSQVRTAYKRAKYKTANLEFAWTFMNVGSAAVVADTVRGISANLVNVSVADRTASGIVLRGANQHISLDINAAGPFGGELTIELVATWRAFTGALFYASDLEIAHFHSGAAATAELKWWDTGLFSGTSTTARSGDSTELKLKERYHIVTVVSSTRMCSYINGVKKGETFGAGLAPALRAGGAGGRLAYYIGRQDVATAAPNFHTGEVFALSVYYGAMTDAEVKAAYLAHPMSKIVFYWNFANAQNVTIMDEFEGNSNGVAATLMNGGPGCSSCTATGFLLDGIDNYIDLDLDAQPFGGNSLFAAGWSIEIVAGFTSAGAPDKNDQATIVELSTGALNADSITIQRPLGTGALNSQVRAAVQEYGVAFGGTSSAAEINYRVQHFLFTAGTGHGNALYVDGLQVAQSPLGAAPAHGAGRRVPRTHVRIGGRALPSCVNARYLHVRAGKNPNVYVRCVLLHEVVLSRLFQRTHSHSFSSVLHTAAGAVSTATLTLTSFTCTRSGSMVRAAPPSTSARHRCRVPLLPQRLPQLALTESQAEVTTRATQARATKVLGGRSLTSVA
jgi:hypothetical protein